MSDTKNTTPKVSMVSDIVDDNIDTQFLVSLSYYGQPVVILEKDVDSVIEQLTKLRSNNQNT